GEVERLRADFDVMVTTGVELLRQHRVHVLVAWRACDADGTVAPRAQRDDAERVDVEPVIDVLIRGDWITDAVRPLVAALTLQRARAAISDGDREPGASLDDAAQLPAADDRVHEPGGLAGP